MSVRAHLTSSYALDQFVRASLIRAQLTISRVADRLACILRLVRLTSTGRSPRPRRRRCRPAEEECVCVCSCVRACVRGGEGGGGGVQAVCARSGWVDGWIQGYRGVLPLPTGKGGEAEGLLLLSLPTGKGGEAEGLLPWHRGLQVQAAPYGVGLHRYRQGRRRRRCGVATRRHERMQAHARKYADALTQYPAWGRRKARGIDNHRGGCLPPRTRFSLHAHTWNMVK